MQSASYVPRHWRFAHNWIALCLVEGRRPATERPRFKKFVFDLWNYFFFLLSSIAGCECLCYIFFFRLRCVMVASWCVARADSNLASRRNFNIDDTAQRILHDNIIIPIHIYIYNGNEGVEFPGDWLPRSVRTIALCAMLWEPMRQQQTIFHLPPSHPLCLIILPSCLSLSLSGSHFMLLWLLVVLSRYLFTEI